MHTCSSFYLLLLLLLLLFVINVVFVYYYYYLLLMLFLFSVLTCSLIYNSTVTEVRGDVPFATTAHS